MIPKIYARSVMKMGREPKHSLMVIIPKRICEKLQIEKGTRLYFKLENCIFAVSKDSKFLDNGTDNNDDMITIESTNQITKEKENKIDAIVDGVSLADLQY
jgi:antitoxin component of MazEF toxin-antitoxin module